MNYISIICENNINKIIIAINKVSPKTKARKWKKKERKILFSQNFDSTKYLIELNKYSFGSQEIEKIFIWIKKIKTQNN